MIPGRWLWWRALRWVLLGLGLFMVAIQFIPYGWWHDNPAVIQDAPWPDADEADDAIDEIENGSMPLDRYTLIHRGASLSDQEKVVLVRALEAMSDDDD